MIRKSKQTTKLREWLVEDLCPHRCKLERDLIDSLVLLLLEALGKESADAKSVARVLIEEISSVQKAITGLVDGHTAFNSRHAVMETEEEKRNNILSYATELGATPKELEEDRKAFRRYMDHNVMSERYHARLGDQHRTLVFLFERLGHVAREAISDSEDPVAAWRTLNIEVLTSSQWNREADPRIAESAFGCFANSFQGIPAVDRKSVLPAEILQTIHRLALDTEKDVWLQGQAITFLFHLSSGSFDDIARARLIDPPVEDRDDIFVRRTMVPMVAAYSGWPALLCSDPSPFVRQGLAESARKIHPDELYITLETLILRDGEPSVRAAGLLAIPELLGMEQLDLSLLAGIVIRSLQSETDDYVSRIAIKVCVEGHEASPDSEKNTWRKLVLPALRQVYLGAEKVSVRRWAAQGREKIWCDSDPRLIDLKNRVAERLRSIAPGQSFFFRDRFAASLDDATLGRVLSTVAQDDFGLEVNRRRTGIRIQRGHRFGFRLWRLIHELRDPSPDKREGFNHTIGRVFSGSLRIPSALLSEMSETKVPGEPLTLSDEEGWRPFLPLVDEVISSLDENSTRKPLRVITSEGTTLLRPPVWPVKRMRAHHTLNYRFHELARLRNSDTPHEYINALRKLGFECEFQPPEGEAAEPEVSKTFAHGFFPALSLPFQVDPEKIRDYFYSAYENSIGHLLIFLAGALTFFLSRHIYLNQKFFRLRKKIPLVIGGWGTRGKSGTERLKAAMLNSLGHRLVSKTTGCEAMFLYSSPFGKLHELFLFRPYDKATIWEQVNLVGLAAKLKSRVFLWECMALTPAYVEILQRQWMKDDIATIVNTYPDHEDLQGPAGVNIPEVMTNFLVKDGHCLTSEQQMTPILEAAADQLNCRLDKVGWVEPGLLTPDILARFPYEEHPNNIALVAELGSHLGIPRDRALKEMADRVVPDLGVLKVYPEAGVAGRRLQLVNGFSANERFGALGNWKRLGFHQQDPEKEPGVWISAVINNRADRIARSRVFADIVARDIAFDQLYLIGSNLKGMVGYIHESFHSHSQEITLFPEEKDEPPTDILRREARRLRIPASEDELRKRVEAIAEVEDPSPWAEPPAQAYQEYEAFSKKLTGGSDRKSIDREFRELLWRWFSRKLIVISDYHATGEQIIHRIAEATPPGYLNRIMGLQNIKGTGLDFVYRWQAWDRCHQACEKIINRKLKIAREGLVELASFHDFGLLCESKVSETITQSAKTHAVSDAGFQSQLDLIETAMTQSLDRIKPSLGGKKKASSGRFSQFIFGVLESLIDSGDAVRRRRKANQIYRDLGDERISSARVIREIQDLNRRQKGGWLKKAIQKS